MLLVDDDEDVHLLVLAGLRRAAQRPGVQLESAYDGVEALQLASARRFDLILSDVNMPGLTGPQLIRELRERLIPTPVVLIGAMMEGLSEELAAGRLDKTRLLDDPTRLYAFLPS